MFRSIFTLTTPGEVCALRVGRGDRHADRFPKAAESMRNARTDVLAFTAFPAGHWRKIWSNNPLERLNKEIKRRVQRRRYLPERPGRDPPDRRRARRSARRVAGRSPLPPDTSMTELASSTPADARLPSRRSNRPHQPQLGAAVNEG